jgi:hypothetical protein
VLRFASDIGHFGLRGVATLGYASGHFGLRQWPLWVTPVATLGYGTGHFGLRIFCWNFSQVSDNKQFVKYQNGPNLINFVFNKNNTNKQGDGALLKV